MTLVRQDSDFSKKGSFCGGLMSLVVSGHLTPTEAGSGPGGEICEVSLSHHLFPRLPPQSFSCIHPCQTFSQANCLDRFLLKLNIFRKASASIFRKDAIIVDGGEMFSPILLDVVSERKQLTARERNIN